MEFSASVVLAVGKELYRYVVGTKRTREDAINDLRLLKFSDGGVVDLVSAVAEGRKMRPEVAQELIADFNDKQWQVVEAMQRLAADCPGISNKMRSELMEVAYAKRGVRAAVQSLANSPRPAEQTLTVEDARGLLIDIGQLNRAIDDVEDILVHGRGRA